MRESNYSTRLMIVLFLWVNGWWEL